VNPDPAGQNFDGDIDYDAWAATMDTNVFGVMRITKVRIDYPLALWRRTYPVICCHSPHS
jgi:hypothetical protein